MDIEILALRFYDHSKFIKGYSRETIKRYKNVIRLYPRLANISQIGQVNEENVRAFFFHGRTQRAWKTNTFICYHNSLLVFFRWCVEQGVMEKNPVEGMELPRLEKKLPTKLTKQVTLRLLEVVYNFPYD